MSSARPRGPEARSGERAAGGLAPSPTSYETLRERQVASVVERMTDLLKPIRWSAARLEAHRTQSLRALVRRAMSGSPWHRRRLNQVDADTLQVAQLASLPVMTKSDLMTHFDEIVTDPEITLDRVESHLAGLSEDRYLLERYHAVASSGSDGQRGLFVYDWEAWVTCFVGFLRHLTWELLKTKGPHRRIEVGVIAAGKASHMSCALFQTFESPDIAFHLFPATLPLDAIVEGLNDVRPEQLIGYPSMLHRLAEEARRGRLRIAPRHLVVTAEPLSAEARAAIEANWDAKLWNVWATSEAGPHASSCGRGRGLHLNEDLVIVEPVDEGGCPVPPGVRSAKVYLTNLYNPVLPLIRYELDDQVTLIDEACACGSVHRRVEDVHGRSNESFLYANGATVHSFVFETALEHERNVLEYQVRQTERGADVTVCCEGHVDLSRLEATLARDLAGLGLPAAEVTVRAAPRPERGATGKLKRFVPLPARGPTDRGLPDGS
jgi:phenylacetate-CoA ligase